MAADGLKPAVAAFSATRRALLLAGLTMLAGRPAAAQGAPSLDDIARFLAGMPAAPDSPLAFLMRDRSWLLHQSQLDAAFRAHEARQLSKMRVWAAAKIGVRQPTLLYPFSGPDFLHADPFFPDADTTVLAALEPVGSIPDLIRSRDALPALLSHLRDTMRSSLSFTFFITRQMREELNVTRMSGVMPILFVYLARSGKTVREAAPVHVDDKGNVHVGDSGRSGARGIRIVFRGGKDRRDRTLYYFTTNLANDGFRRSGFAAFCESLGRHDAMLKSASYLLHQNGFSHVRDFLLERSSTILQDDSGIPVTRFDPNRWTIRTFGRGMEPIGEFANYPQPLLKDFYRQHMQGPLDFGFGYRHRANETGIVLAIRKEHARPETTAAGTPSMRPPEPVPPQPAPAAPPQPQPESSLPFRSQIKPMQPQSMPPHGVRDIAH
jgi:hypothetical protein